MKTKVFVTLSLLVGGLIFSSCQKDNALIEDDAFAQNLTKNELSVKHDTIAPDPIKNYPDPFMNTTTIEYVLEENGLVNLSVSNNETGLVKVLVNGLQSKGVHYVKFEAYNLPVGTYIAELQIGDRVYTEVMTKKGVITYQDIQENESDR